MKSEPQLIATQKDEEIETKIAKKEKRDKKKKKSSAQRANGQITTIKRERYSEKASEATSNAD